MEYFTSYCAMGRKIPKDYLQVSIMRYCPDWYKSDLELKGLSPKGEDLMAYKQGSISQLEFIKRYTEKVLKPLNLESMNTYFETNYSRYKGVVFMCVEKSEDFCHRHLLSRYINTNSDLVCTEMEFK